MCGYVPGVHDVDHDRGAALRPPAEVLVGFSSERVLDAPECDPEVLLGIDTALGTSVALGVGGRVFEVVSDDQRGHAEVIGELLARVCERSGVSPEQVTGVVSGVGPGPFTGLRVGMAAAHAFAAARRVPVRSVLSHEAVALAVCEAGHTQVRVVQDARRRELFVTEFDGLDGAGLPVRVADAHLVTREAFVPAAADVWPERIPAARLVQLAARRLAAGREFEADQARYLRAPDARPPAPRTVVDSGAQKGRA